MATQDDYSLLTSTITSAGGTSGVYVSPFAATINNTLSATYHLDVTDNDAVTDSTLNYDMIFDLTLNAADSTTLLNAFTVANVQIAPSTSAADTERAGFADNAEVKALLIDILTTRAKIAGTVTGPTTTPFWAENDTITDYLNKQLNAFVNGKLTDNADSLFNASATANTASQGGLPAASLTVYTDADSGTAVPDISGAYESMLTSCFGPEGANALVRQIKSSTFIGYDNGSNGLTTGALPLLSGDSLVFGIATNNSLINMSPTDRTVAGGAAGEPVAGLPNGAFGATFDSSEVLPSQTLAIRLLLTDSTAGTPFTVATGTTPGAGELKKYDFDAEQLIVERTPV